jgi:hypothetical protein
LLELKNAASIFIHTVIPITLNNESGRERHVAPLRILHTRWGEKSSIIDWLKTINCNPKALTYGLPTMLIINIGADILDAITTIPTRTCCDGVKYVLPTLRTYKS